MKYTSLHNHSDVSPDGAGTVQSLVGRAAKLGMSYLALTDHGTLANAVAFWSACAENDVIPIQGVEAYLAYEGKRHHITLLSLNEEGFNNLVHLDSHAHAHGFDAGYPTVTLSDLETYQSGIYALTGCASSAIHRDEEDDGLLYVANLVDIFGRERVGLETMFIGTHNTWERPLKFAKQLGLRHVVTNDTHYPCQHQFPAHQAITKSRKGYTYDSYHLWLKTAEEILHEGSKFTDREVVVQGLLNTMVVAGMVKPWDMRSAPSLPHIEAVEETLTAVLRSALKQDVARKGGKEVRLERLRKEFRVLHERKFLDYIYILWDIVRWAKDSGVRVGPGRGSGGGSYLLYLLGITQVDPIEYGLMFERFLNPAREDYPDIDVDFESDRRQQVMEYASNRWGTVPIATYSCYSHKSAVHDIARTLHIPKDLEIPAAEDAVDGEAFEQFINDKPDALVTYETMIGQIRHRGKHAAGVIIPNRPVPIERAPDGNLVAAWAEGMNTKDLSKVGIVKYDLLGLTALSQLRRMEEISGVAFGESGYDDPDVLGLFRDGSVAGIFQWSGSDGIRELTKRVAPTNFYDLTTCNALYRPGALDAGTAEQYPEFMKSPRKLHPDIDPILEKTYGVICYQEQVMAIVAEVMGGDLSQADLARRLISKSDVGNPKWEKQIEELHYQFLDQGVKQGFASSLLDKLWHEVYTHSRYSYNLSHATTYTMISYQMAWYKLYHRAAFTVAVLQYDKANSQTYILDAIESGLRIEMPHINYSGKEYELVDNTIFLPLSDVAYLGEKAVDAILEARLKVGNFTTFEQLAEIPKRALNNRGKTMLERIGAFSGIDGDPTKFIEKYEKISVGNRYETQLEILGYIVPSRELYAKMKRIASEPAKKGKTRFAGFINRITKKKSIHGEYTVFNLSPEGSFWTREPRPSMKVGAFVSGTKSHFGHSIDVKTYKLSGE